MTAGGTSVATQPLSDVRVLELAGGIAGSYAAKLFADLGADVIKLEPPGGDRVRLAGPFPDGQAAVEQGALHLHLDTNKRSVAVAIPTAEGQDLVRHLLPSVEDGRAACRERGGKSVSISVGDV